MKKKKYNRRRAEPRLARIKDADQSSAPSNSRSVDSSTDEGRKIIVQKLEHELEPVLPDKAKRDTAINKVVSVVSEIYHGPLPHPKHFEEFERVCPGAGSRIISMAELAQQRSEDRIDKMVDYEFSYKMRGLNLAAAVLYLFVIAGVILVLSGSPQIGTGLLILSGLSAIAGRFIDGRKNELPPGPPSKRG